MGAPVKGEKAISTVTAAPALRRDGDDITDHELVARVRAGDDRAFEALYTRYNRRIASYVQGMVHDHARAEDITQDVFMSALRRMRETDRTIAFKPWIYEIAKNACIDQFRRARRAEEVSMDADEGLGSADYGRLVSSSPTPDVAVDHKQQLDHLCGAFGGLSETHHEILVMRELEGLSYREIGEKLGMTRPAVESTLFRARRRLTEEYDQLVTGERCVRVQGIIAAAGGSDLGARDKRRVARHVSYCQPCMRQARMSGLDAGELVHRPVRQKIAAFLPLPAFLKERWGGAPSPDAHVSLYNLSAQASTLDPGVVSTWGKAAATAATIAIAGVSAGVATDNRDKLQSQIGGGAVSVLTGGDSGSSSSSSTDPRAGGGSGSGAGGASGTTTGGAASKGSKAERAAARGNTGTATAGASAPRDGGGATTTGAAPADSGGGAAEPATEDPGTAAGRLLEGVGRGSAGNSGGSGGGGGTTSGGGGGAGGNAGVQPPNIELPSVQAPTAGGGAPSAPEPATDQKTDDPVQDVIEDATGLLGGG